MRQWQLRMYRLKPSMMDGFIQRWRDDLVPLRLANDFEIVGAWVDRENDEFAWIVAAGDDDQSFSDKEAVLAEARARLDFNAHDYIDEVLGVKMLIACRRPGRGPHAEVRQREP